jgi:hypothetical protein
VLCLAAAADSVARAVDRVAGIHAIVKNDASKESVRMGGLYGRDS